MSNDKEATARHEMQNIYLQHAIDTGIYHKLLFCADYLDLLAIQERHEVEKDTVFVKTSFPCILQPNSLIVYVNDMFIIASTIIVSFLLPYMCFVPEDIPDLSYTIVTTVTFQNLLDIYVQLSTGINTRHGMISKVTSIAALKLRDVAFWCDIISCIPVEVFSAVFVQDMDHQNRARLRLNRLTKLYRMYTFFQKWEQKLNVNTVVVRYIKFGWIHLYCIYFVSCIFMGHYPDKSMTSVVFRAVQFVTTVGLIDKDLYGEPILYLGLDLLFFTIKLIMYSQIASAFAMMNYRKMQKKITCTDILDKLKIHNISEKYNQRAARFLSTQNLYKIFVKGREGYFYTAEMNKYLQDDIREFLLSDLLSSHVFFQLLPNDCIKDVCSIMIPLTLPSNEVIIYAGDMSSKVYIVWCGKFTTYDANSEHIKVIRGDRVVNLVPAIFKSSAALSYVTVTDCRLIYFDINEFKQVLTKYPKYLNIFNATVSNCGDIANDLKQYAKEQAITDLTPLLRIREKSFYFFGFNQKVDSFEEFDYYLPFDHLYPFSFIRTLLMRVTIMPNGLFIRIWESFRCVFAVSTCLLVFTRPVNSLSLEFVIAFLDVTAFADIYVRLHVCYYNEKGLLVKHPQMTALHYLTNGFLIDFLGAFPFRYILSNGSSASSTVFIIHMNCLLQLHRYSDDHCI
ncbi:cyclic nucleotide-gated cation channel subunit a [Holotrichia oblita]|uniref:Cyclic nucleotide-gated cation channel subunit a n=1 Tax=Holotrichia oblita TaxID=644536 RepID=A0ACB9SPI9_HOLOL|nr:cyclic nucleotide-gated cation channel subunit a [Holotrichia oblita]